MVEKKTKKQEKGSKKSDDIVNLVGTRGRHIEGYVVKKFSNRVVIEYERTVYVHKFERFYKKKSRIHARLPQGMSVEIGDYIQVHECRPLSKIIHHVVVSKIKSAEVKK